MRGIKNIDRLTRIVRYSVAVAACVLFIVIAIEVYLFYRLSAFRLYKEKYSPFELNVANNDTLQSNTIEKWYRVKDYKQIIKVNKKLALTDPEQMFLAGMAYLETADLTKAINAFRLVNTKNRIYKTRVLQYETDYYLALAYLKNKDYDFAIELMRKIQSDPQHFYKKKFGERYIRRVKMLKWR